MLAISIIFQALHCQHEVPLGEVLLESVVVAEYGSCIENILRLFDDLNLLRVGLWLDGAFQLFKGFRYLVDGQVKDVPGLDFLGPLIVVEGVLRVKGLVANRLIEMESMVEGLASIVLFVEDVSQI